MDFEWVAIALGDVTWISLAFFLGYLASRIGLPPLVGFLATGFLLNYLGFASGDMLEKLADLGVTLLLFTVGLKLNLKTLARPQVWMVTALHVLCIITLFGGGIFILALLGLPLFAALEFEHALLLGFALSFSSTVFVVKLLETKGEMKSLHGRIAIGILVVQDLAAVIFLAASTGKLPAEWSPLLLLLILLRPLLLYLLRKTGHGELLVLYGLVLALGGAEIFELGGVKDDLGALIMGMMIASHPKASEMAKVMLNFKDLFLVGFFLTIGMTGELSLAAFVVGALLVPFVLIKSGLFFLLLNAFRLRARTALLTTLNLTNYSEFGLIVVAIGVANGWLAADWLVVLAIALSLSYVLSSPLNDRDDHIYSSKRKFWRRFQSSQRLPDDRLLHTAGARIAVFGMGRVGSGAYDKMRELHGDTVIGVDFNADLVKKHCQLGRNALHGDPSDADFWDKTKSDGKLELVMLALPNLQANLDALDELREVRFTGRIAAIARYPDEVPRLQKAGATAVFNIYTEAGAGFAEHVERQDTGAA